MANNTTPRLESIQDILGRGHRSAGLLILQHFPTREMVEVFIRDGKPTDKKIDVNARVYIFRAAFP